MSQYLIQSIKQHLVLVYTLEVTYVIDFCHIYFNIFHGYSYKNKLIVEHLLNTQIQIIIKITCVKIFHNNIYLSHLIKIFFIDDFVVVYVIDEIQEGLCIGCISTNKNQQF